MHAINKKIILILSLILPLTGCKIFSSGDDDKPSSSSSKTNNSVSSVTSEKTSSSSSSSRGGIVVNISNNNSSSGTSSSSSRTGSSSSSSASSSSSSQTRPSSSSESSSSESSKPSSNSVESVSSNNVVSSETSSSVSSSSSSSSSSSNQNQGQEQGQGQGEEGYQFHNFDFTNHSYVNKLKYTKHGNSYYSISIGTADDGTTDEVVIPTTYNGLPVTTIDTEGFASLQHIKYIYVPDSVQHIGDSAFSYVDVDEGDPIRSVIEEVRLSTMISTAGSYLFSDDYNLKCVTLDGNFAFSDDGKIFENCYELEYVDLGTGLTNIPLECFINCYKLNSITIPTTVTSIGGSAFLKCPLTQLVVPEGVISIGNGFISGCTDLVEVRLPSTLESVDYSVFISIDQEHSVKDVYYNNTIAKWNTLTHNGGFGYKTGMTVHCIDGNISY